MNKLFRILAIVIGVSAMIDIINALFINTEITDFTIIKYHVSKLSYLIYKFLIALILISTGIKGIKNKSTN